MGLYWRSPSGSTLHVLSKLRSNMDVLKVLLVVVICGHAALASCPDSEQIECGTSSRCTRIRYICDRDNDCGDGSDEESDMCNAWRNDQCERGQVKCCRFGSNDCMAISRYCELEDPPCEGDLDRRICQMMADEKLQSLHSIVLPTSEGERLVEQSIVEAVEELGEEFLVQVESTLRHPDCPDLYTRVGHCAALTYGNYFYISDELCISYKSPLCVANPERNISGGSVGSTGDSQPHDTGS